MNLYAFYLPQFHRTDTNDKWWGDGFTEWTAAKRTKPMYDGHYQPHEPLNDYYYNLLDKEAMVWQSRIMHEYGIDGMCIYHYWFSSTEKILEKPAENLLEWTDVDMPFFFCWANESWLNKWSHKEGFVWKDTEEERNKDLRYIYFQTYGREEEWEKHFNYLLPFFKDPRYIRKNDKPIFVFLNIYNIPCLEEMLAFWNELAKKKGLNGLYYIGGGLPDIDTSIDLYITHEPGNLSNRIRAKSGMLSKTYSYKDAARIIEAQKYYENKNVVYTTFCSYDTTPRYGIDGEVYFDSTPRLFQEHLERVMAKNELAHQDITFIDAWNEWGEGMHLEPDKKYKYEWLKAVSQAKHNYKRVVAKNEYVDECERFLMKNCRRREIYLATLDRWMKLCTEGIYITDWLKEQSIDSILIYGMNALEDHFLTECKRNGVSVKGVIDKGNHLSADNIAMYKVNGKLPKVDAIVVTAIYYMKEIREEIRANRIDVPVFSVMELVLFAEKKRIENNNQSV